METKPEVTDSVAGVFDQVALAKETRATDVRAALPYLQAATAPQPIRSSFWVSDKKDRVSSSHKREVQIHISLLK